MNASAAPQTPAVPRGPADAATLKLVEELRTLAADTLGRGIERMFDGADDMLFEMARRATNNKDQRIYFDTMRVVRLGRPKIGKIFREEISAGFTPSSNRAGESKSTEIAFENLSLQESKSLEESIAISTMATKAENLYSNLLFELGRRVEWLIKERNAPISQEALAPATISLAFRRSAEALDVEFDIELVIFKLFDRLVISDLGELYNRVLRFLDQNGVKPAAISAGLPRPGLPAGRAGAIPPGAPVDPSQVPGAMPPDAGGGVAGLPVPQGYGFAQPPMMDAATLNALRNLSASSGASGAYSHAAAGTPAYYAADAQLGADLAAAAAGQLVPGWEAPRAYAYVQRAGAVGQMFNELMQDPTLPAPLKPRFDQLRFSVIKSALHDSNFFADRQHPVRGLMNELTTLAASARASGMEALRRIEELVGQIQSQFDVAADDVRTQSALPSPVDEKTLETFFAQQKEDARQRRQAIIERTRRVVAEELQLHTLSRKIPESVWPVLNSGWAPLAALRLLKQGADSDGWRDAMDLLRRVLESTDPRRPASRSQGSVDELAQDLADRFHEIGMIEERIHALLRSWRAGLEEVEAEATATRPMLPTPMTAPPAPREAVQAPAVVVPAPTPPVVVTLPPAAAANGEDAQAKAVADTAALLDEIPFDLGAPDEPALLEDLAHIEGEAERVSVPPADDSDSLLMPEMPPELLTPIPREAARPAVVAPAAAPVAVAPAAAVEPAEPRSDLPDPVTLLDLLMVLSSWFRVYDHDRGQNRWLKVIAHHPGDGTVTFAEFNGQNKLQLRTQVFLDDLVAGRAEPIDLGPAARRSLDAYLTARRSAANASAVAA